MGTDLPDAEIKNLLIRKKFPNLERADIRLGWVEEEIGMFLKSHGKLHYLQIEALDKRLIKIIAKNRKRAMMYEVLQRLKNWKRNIVMHRTRPTGIVKFVKFQITFIHLLKRIVRANPQKAYKNSLN